MTELIQTHLIKKFLPNYQQRFDKYVETAKMLNSENDKVDEDMVNAILMYNNISEIIKNYTEFITESQIRECYNQWCGGKDIRNTKPIKSII
jgi:hypothetical protein